jgi:hypothetical protein
MRRYGYSIFCDDIRSEAGGKLSFIGCYNAIMMTDAAVPATSVQVLYSFSRILARYAALRVGDGAMLYAGRAGADRRRADRSAGTAGPAEPAGQPAEE